jgi:hypothetical protein
MTKKVILNILIRKISSGFFLYQSNRILWGKQYGTAGICLDTEEIFPITWLIGTI